MDPIDRQLAADRGPGAGRDWFKLGAALVGVIVFVVAVVEGLAWYKHSQLESAPPPAPAAAPAPQAPAAESGPAHPLPPAPAQAPLTLEGSDAPLMLELARLTGASDLARWVRPTNLARHFVATVDALPRRQVPQQAMPTTPVPGKFLVITQQGSTIVSPDNAKRYLPWVHLLLSVDPAAAAATYKSYYPVLQQAYRELGYPQAYFNDRLIEAIDDILQAPEDAGVLKVESPSVMWKYANEDLEELSAGQKILLRLGPVNGKAVRTWLAAFRAKIA